MRTSQICTFSDEKLRFCTFCSSVFHFCTLSKVKVKQPYLTSITGNSKTIEQPEVDGIFFPSFPTLGSTFMTFIKIGRAASYISFCNRSQASNRSLSHAHSPATSALDLWAPLGIHLGSHSLKRLSF